MAPESSLTVQPDASLAVHKHPGEDTAALDATLSTLAEPANATETQRIYQLTAASIWRARRQGLSLADILQTLQTHSQTEIPATVRDDIERWSKQIDRLTLEADQGRLLLLFGSQARSDAEPGSDIDVLVVLRGKVSPCEEIARTIEDVADVSLHHNEVVFCVFVSEEQGLRARMSLRLNSS